MNYNRLLEVLQDESKALDIVLQFYKQLPPEEQLAFPLAELEPEHFYTVPGTLIRLFSTSTGQPYTRIRRDAELLKLLGAKYLSVSSDDAQVQEWAEKMFFCQKSLDPKAIWALSMRAVVFISVTVNGQRSRKRVLPLLHSIGLNSSINKESLDKLRSQVIQLKPVKPVSSTTPVFIHNPPLTSSETEVIQTVKLNDRLSAAAETIKGKILHHSQEQRRLEKLLQVINTEGISDLLQEILV